MSLQGRRFAIVYWSFALVILFCVGWYHVLMASKTPVNHEYSYAVGHTGDYYAYITMIRRGREGHLLFRNMYSEITSPDALIHPFFHLLGFISRPFPVSPFQIFFIGKISALLAFFYAAYCLIITAIPRSRTRILAGVLLISATSFWHLVQTGGSWALTTPKTWSDYFDPYNRYIRIPPHHYLAFACFMGIIVLLARRSDDMKTRGCIIALTIATGLLQPYISFLLLVIVSYDAISQVFITKTMNNRKLLITGSIVGVSAAMILMNAYMLQSVLHSPFAATSILSVLPRSVSVATYFFALGPLVIMACMSVLPKASMGKPIVRMIALWAVAPVVLFLLPNISNVTETNRLLQTYQQVPLAILAAIGIEHIVTRLSLPSIMIGSMMLAGMVYGGIPFYSMMSPLFGPTNTNEINIYIPNGLIDLFLICIIRQPVTTLY